MPDFDYDLFVIGAGSGGVRAARMSALYGARVGIAEAHRVGGTCVIRGCVPKKLLVYASRLGDAIEDAKGYGWQVPAHSFDWTALRAAKDAEIDRLEGLYVRNLEKTGATLFRSRATLMGPHTIRLEADGREVTAAHILIATGGTPAMPPIEGLALAMTSNDIFYMDTLPKSIIIIGGGYIGAEFAGILHGFGVEVHIVALEPGILWEFDADLRAALAQEYAGRGIKLHMNAQATRVRRTEAGFAVELKDGATLEAAAVLNATGRVPNTRDLGLEAVGVELGWNGHVVVDAYSRSSIDHIYAVGDVTHRMALTPVAIREGAAFAETVFNNTPTAVDHSLIPTAVFSEPEVASIGLKETEAREKYRQVDIYKSRFTPMLHSLSGRAQKMLMKLVVDGESDKVLGCHIMGPDAGEIIQTLAIAIRMGATKADLDATMALHPSAAEELVTMREKWQPEVPEEG